MKPTVRRCSEAGTSLDRLIRLGGMKQRGEKIVAVQCGDAVLARAVSRAGADMLIADSNIICRIQGNPPSVSVVLCDILYHLNCISQEETTSLIVAEIPDAYRLSSVRVLEAAKILTARGANAVLLTGFSNLSEHVRLLTVNGIPVCVRFTVSYEGASAASANNKAAARLDELMLELERAGTALFITDAPSVNLEKKSRMISVPTLSATPFNAVDGRVISIFELLMENEVLPQSRSNETADLKKLHTCFRTMFNHIRNE